MAFEYQGIQHYEDVFVNNRISARFYKVRDQEKADACRRGDITLIVVPYWWNRSIHSLRATIKKARPELIPQEVDAPVISQTRPTKPAIRYPS
jgi:hypothetical protein